MKLTDILGFGTKAAVGAATGGPLGVVMAVAPTIGKALSGPLGTMAVGFLADALGLPKGSTGDAIDAAIAADPMALAKIKEGELAFKAHLDDNGVDLEKIAAADRADARHMAIETHSKMPAAIALIILLAWIALQGCIFFFPANAALVPPETMAGMQRTMEAVLMLAVAFWLGSSSGSRNAQATISQIAKGP